jgi:hypothetical protein
VNIKRVLLTLTAIGLLGGLILLIAYFVPLPIASNRDFITLYYTNWTFTRGIDLYDYPSQLALLQSELKISFPFHPYPYPPWFALATFYLGSFPIEIAARIWFQLNLLMLTASVWMLTTRWKPRSRLLALAGALLFIPTLGHLVVGQSATPILLGLALFIWSVRTESSMGIALAFGLLTFKPNLGIFPLLAFTGWLLYQRHKPFARRAIILITAMAVFLFAVGFIADPAWPLTYLHGLGGWHEYPVAETCNLCASLTANLIQAFQVEYTDRVGAIWGLILFLITGIPFIWHFRRQVNHPELLAVITSCLTLLAFPYLLNYDFILLVVPMLVLAERLRLSRISMPGAGAMKSDWTKIMLLVVAYCLPWGMVIWGRDADLLLIGATFLLLILAWQLDWGLALDQTDV